MPGKHKLVAGVSGRWEREPKQTHPILMVLSTTVSLVWPGAWVAAARAAESLTLGAEVVMSVQAALMT